MRIIVCGGRDYDDEATVRRFLEGQVNAHPDDPITIIQGEAKGADRLAKWHAACLGCKVESYRALWNKHGKSAGPIRNIAMAESGADLCIAFPGGKGTDHMIATAQKYDIPVLLIDQSYERE